MSGSEALGAAAGVTCRLMQEDDATRVAELAGQLGYPSSPEQILARKGHLDRQSESAIYVAEWNGEIVGWLMVCEMRSIESDPYGEIRGLVVADGVRGRGIGEFLMQAGEAWARERGLHDMAVRSNVIRERAHAFYARLGYVEQKRQVKLRKKLA